MERRIALQFAAFGVVFAMVVPLWANPLDTYGLGARGIATGSAMTAAVNDYTAVYYNPAGLAHAHSGMGAGLMMAYDDVNIRLKPRPSGYDIPDLGPGGPLIGYDRRLRPRGDTQDINNFYGIHFGMVGSLGLPNLRVGFAAMLPVNHLMSQDTRYPNEQEQYFSNRLDFELLGARDQHQVIMAGLAYQLTDWLAVGTAVSFLPQAMTNSQAYLSDPAHQENLQMVVHNDQSARFAQQAGITLTPNAPWQLGLTWRGENYFRLDINNEIQVKGFQNDSTFPTPQHSTFIANFQPHQIVAGSQYNAGRLHWTLDIARQLWSRYLDSLGNLAGFHDTTSVRSGLEYQATGDRTLMAGLRWEPTPVPDQNGRSNYVDNDRIVASVGATHQMKIFGSPVDLGWYAQWHHLLARDTNKVVPKTYVACGPGVKTLCDELPDNTKDAYGQTIAQAQGLQTGNPGFPGFQSWGDLLAVGMDLKWAF